MNELQSREAGRWARRLSVAYSSMELELAARRLPYYVSRIAGDMPPSKSTPSSVFADHLMEAFFHHGLVSDPQQMGEFLLCLSRHFPERHEHLREAVRALWPEYPLGSPTALQRVMGTLTSIVPVDTRLRVLSARQIRRIAADRGQRPQPPDFRVFVSYRRRDAPGFTRALHGVVVGHIGPEHVFLDTSTIRPGEDFQARIHSEIARSSLLLVVIGSGFSGIPWPGSIWWRADWVRREIETSLELGIPVQPVLVNGAQVPRLLPASVSSLLRVNALRLSHENWDSDVGRLLAFLDHHRSQFDRSRVHP